MQKKPIAKKEEHKVPAHPVHSPVVHKPKPKPEPPPAPEPKPAPPVAPDPPASAKLPDVHTDGSSWTKSEHDEAVATYTKALETEDPDAGRMRSVIDIHKP